MEPSSAPVYLYMSYNSNKIPNKPPNITMGGCYVSWNKENYKSFGMVLKSSLKWAQPEVSSFSGLDFMLTEMRVVNFLMADLFR